MDDELERLLRAARTDDATRSRASVVALRELAAEEATILGVLRDLADHRSRVGLVVGGERRVVGAVREVWSGGVELAGTGVGVLVRTAAIDAVTSPDGRRLHGDARTTPSRSWPALLHDRVDLQDEVELATGRISLRGRMLSIGLEVVVLAGVNGSIDYVRTEAIDSVIVSSVRPRTS